jgi:hypothetical protein
MSKIHYPKEWWDFKGETPPPTEDKYVDPPEEEVVRIVTRILAKYMYAERFDYNLNNKPEGHIYLDLLTLEKGLENHELHKT